MAWNYELLSSLWQQNGWLDNKTALYASTHYGAYAVRTKQGLKVISTNTDFYYTPNVLNFFNYPNPDNSGILKFLISELEASEKLGQRVWIIGHVLSGGGSSTNNPTAIFSSVVKRFSPATIAEVFNGHTQGFEAHLLRHQSCKLYHQEHNIDYHAPLNIAWVGPSIAPRTNYNAGWSIYQVDSKTFSVVNSQTYFANISNSLAWTEPKWELEYDTRATYDPWNKWPAIAPLNATFWDQVTTKMMNDSPLLDHYSFLETKSSNQVPVCTDNECRMKAICLIRSGSAAEAALC
jgi:sphingomyelin phosphodiesterase